MLPGEYPVHTKDGIVKENFKSNVLKVVTGDFKLLKCLSHMDIYGTHS